MTDPVRTISFKNQIRRQATAIVEDPRDIDERSYMAGSAMSIDVDHPARCERNCLIRPAVERTRRRPFA